MQTHSAKTALCRRFSPNGSALWRPHHLKPRPHRHQPGELRHPSLRHAGDTPKEGFAWRKTPTAVSLKCIASPTRPGRSASRREKTRPARPLQRPFREKTRPASTKTPNFGCFERAGRTFSHFRDDTGPQGELFRTQMKTPPPLLTHSRAHMKPAIPLFAHNATHTFRASKGDAGFTHARRPGRKGVTGFIATKQCTRYSTNAPDSTPLHWQLSSAMPPQAVQCP